MITLKSKSSYNSPDDITGIVIAKELSDSLPPMRDIQHAIDFVPRSTLPNLPHYKMKPTEHVELKKQVDELLNKGFIKKKSESIWYADIINP